MDFILPYSLSYFQPSEPSSPQPSVDRLSVSFAPDDKSFSESGEVQIQSPPPVKDPEGGYRYRYGGIPDVTIEPYPSDSEPFKLSLNLYNNSEMADGETSPSPGIPLGMRLSAAGIPGETLLIVISHCYISSVFLYLPC